MIKHRLVVDFTDDDGVWYKKAKTEALDMLNSADENVTELNAEDYWEEEWLQADSFGDALADLLEEDE